MTGRSTSGGGGAMLAATASILVGMLGGCAGEGAETERPERRQTATEPAPTDDGPATDHGSDPPRDAAGTIVTVADDGASLRLRVGDAATLSLAAPVTMDPVVDGSAVRLVAIVNVAGSAVQDWEIQAVEPGRAEVRAEDGQGRTVVIDLEVERAGD